MPVPSKTLLNLYLRWLTFRTQQGIKKSRFDPRSQQALWRRLIDRFIPSARGKLHELEPNISYDLFRREMPLADHFDLVPFVERIQDGEPDVLFPGTCKLFVRTAGTTHDKPWTLPVTEEQQSHFSAATQATMLYATARSGHIDSLYGRVMMLANGTEPDPSHTRCKVTDLPTVAATHLPAWASDHFFEPPASIVKVVNWTEYMSKLIEHSMFLDITTIVAQPHWLLDFAETLFETSGRNNQRTTNLAGVWPNLACIVHTGSSARPYARELRRIGGTGVILHEVFSTAEGIFAAQDSGGVSSLRLLTDVGIFYEFLPVEDWHPSRKAQLHAKLISLEEVATETDYLLVVTTPAGLVRHMTGDIIRFTGLQPHRIVHMGQLGLQLNRFEENVSERDVTDALVAACRMHHWSITQFHVAPLVSTNKLSDVKGCHEWWIELRPGARETPTGPLIARLIDGHLRQNHRRYAEMREAGELDPPVVRLVIPGSFRHWQHHTGRLGSVFKIPRARSDRDLAQSLAGMTRFSHE